MKKQYLSLALAVALSVTTLSGCGSPVSETTAPPVEKSNDAAETQETREAAAYDMEPTVWTCVSYTDSSSEHYAQQAAMCDAIYERTNGLLDIQIYSVGEFSFKGTDMLSVTSDRTVEMTIPSLSYIEGESIISSIVEWPMLTSSNEEIQLTFDVLKPYLDKDFSEKGVELLNWWSTLGLGFYGTGKTPHSLHDLKNRKIRLYSVPITNLLVNYGLVPVSMTIGECIPALQRGVLDGAVTGCLYAYDMAWYEMVDWAYIMNIAGSANGIFVNSEAMNELPPEVQEIVREEAQNYHDVNIEYNENFTQQCIDGMAEHGVEVVYASEEEYEEAAALAVPVWEALAEEAGPECQEALAKVREALGK